MDEDDILPYSVTSAEWGRFWEYHYTVETMGLGELGMFLVRLNSQDMERYAAYLHHYGWTPYVRLGLGTTPEEAWAVAKQKLSELLMRMEEK